MMYRILSTEQQKFPRDTPADRLLPFDSRPRALPRQRLLSARGRGRRLPAIPDKIKTLEELGIPTRLYELADKPRGLVLVTGPTGSGKSTTLASLLDHINHSRHEHILTIEDPSSFCTTTGPASSTSARSARTRRRSRRASCARCARTPT